MIESKIYHRVLLFEIKHVENHEIEQIVAIFFNKTVQRGRIQQWQFLLHMDRYFGCVGFQIA